MPPDLQSQGGCCKLLLDMICLQAMPLIVNHATDGAPVAGNAKCCAASHHTADDWFELCAVNIRAGIQAAHLGTLLSAKFVHRRPQTSRLAQATAAGALNIR